jgi:hypothetical protein
VSHLLYLCVQCCPDLDGLWARLDQAIGLLELSSHLECEQQQQQQQQRQGSDNLTAISSNSHDTAAAAQCAAGEAVRLSELKRYLWWWSQQQQQQQRTKACQDRTRTEKLQPPTSASSGA